MWVCGVCEHLVLILWMCYTCVFLLLVMVVFVVPSITVVSWKAAVVTNYRGHQWTFLSVQRINLEACAPLILRKLFGTRGSWTETRVLCSATGQAVLKMWNIMLLMQESDVHFVTVLQLCKRGIVMNICPSVCPCVKRMDCDKTKASSEKSSIMTNRKSPTSFSTSLRWTMYVAPNLQRGPQKLKVTIFRIKVDLSCKRSMLLVFWHRQKRLMQSIVWPTPSPTTHPKLTQPAVRFLCASWATCSCLECNLLQ